MRVSMSLLLLCALLLVGGSAQNWMAGGNFTAENMTVLLGKAQGLDRSITSSTVFVTAVTAISGDLNHLWAEAWNVVIVRTGTNLDSVLYGYAYRYHWFWYNGIKMNDGRYIALLIWKDWHCPGWRTINQEASDYTSTSQGPLGSFIGGQSFGDNTDDIWGLASTYAHYLQGKYPVMGTDPWSYTVIASQDGQPHHYSRVCAQNYSTTGYLNSAGGWALVLQMHDY